MSVAHLRRAEKKFFPRDGNGPWRQYRPGGSWEGSWWPGQRASGSRGRPTRWRSRPRHSRLPDEAVGGLLVGQDRVEKSARESRLRSAGCVTQAGDLAPEMLDLHNKRIQIS